MQVFEFEIETDHPHDIAKDIGSEYPDVTYYISQNQDGGGALLWITLVLSGAANIATVMAFVQDQVDRRKSAKILSSKVVEKEDVSADGE